MMSNRPLPPSDSEGVNSDSLGPVQPRPTEGGDPEHRPAEEADPVAPPDDQSEMSDNLKRERSKGGPQQPG
jgi:hypothetical protein